MYDRILVPIDGSDPSLAATRHALALATVHGASVHALYVVDTETGWLTVSKSDVRASLREVGEDAAERALGAVEEIAGGFDVPLDTSIREGSPDEAILAAAVETDADLVVIGTHGRDGVRHRIVGSVTERVVRDAPAPVLTVQADETADRAA